ncbi:MAG: zinc dependent phospholipase C family protein [Deltaproteobacteria bacterium]|nr:zinc dependent phospholipase C family protein [Deltaproteobacteria bacterium]
MFYLAPVLLATFVLFFPDTAFAWGPIAHLHFAESILNLSRELPHIVGSILTAYPLDFYYGCIAADITIGKRFVEYMHNCHSWDVGLEILNQAPNPKSKAFAYGYLCHLGADTVSHNYFVPYHLVSAYKTRLLKHIYWEMRFDVVLHRPELAKKAHELAQRGRYQHHDDYLDSILKRTLFSFKTNRRLFSGLILLHNIQQWQRTTDHMHESSRWHLNREQAKEYEDLAVRFISDFFNLGRTSHSYTKDPSGYLTLAEATRKRLELKKKSRLGVVKNEEIEEEITRFKSKLKKKLLSV